MHFVSRSRIATAACLASFTIMLLSVRVLSEIGIDISDQRSKSVSEFLGKISITHAIFVCASAEENCPTVYPFALNKHSWPFDDPAACEGTEAPFTRTSGRSRRISGSARRPHDHRIH
jgi:arsenate reductase (thioredoxin)